MIRAVTLVGFGLIAAAILALQAHSLRTRRSPTFGELVGWLVRPPGGRLLLMAAWLWLGWHIFVRVDV